MWPPLTTSASMGSGEGGLVLRAHLQQHGVDVAFEVVDGDERLAEREGQGLGVGDADEQSAGEAGAFGDGDGVEVVHGDAGFGDGFAHDGDDVAQVLARGEFGHHAAVDGVHLHLRGDDVREHLGAGAHDGGCGLVAGAFDAEDQAAICIISLY